MLFSMNQESLQRIDGFLESSLIELFASHGTDLGPSSDRGGGIDSPIAATIGFTSACMHGVLVLTAARDLVAATLPANLKSGEAGDEIAADWTGELSNQMLGRLKNRFHAVGIDISLSTPIVFVGKEMRHYSQEADIQRALYFAEGRVMAEFHADMERDFEIADQGSESSSAPPEGEILFF